MDSTVYPLPSHELGQQAAQARSRDRGGLISTLTRSSVRQQMKEELLRAGFEENPPGPLTGTTALPPAARPRGVAR